VIAALLLTGVSASSARAQDGFAISGEVDGLFPGADVTLDARVTNPHPFAIRVMSTSATVLDASEGCPASMLQVGDSQAPVEVPPGGTGIVPLDVRMSRNAPDACQGVTWPLRFTGTAIGTPTSGLPGTNMIDPRSLPALIAIGVALLSGALIAGSRARPRRSRRAP
jgi:hypothetical protein